MKVLLYISIFSLIVFLYIIFRFLIQRLSLALKLKKFAKKNSYNCKIVNPLFFIPLNFSNNGLVLIETDSTIYNIRVFGILRKHCEVHFWNIKEYSIKKYYSKLQILASIPLGHQSCHRRKTKGFNPVNIKINSNYKLSVPVFLFSPTNNLIRITQTQENQLKQLKAGDRIDNIIFADTSYLFWYISNREKREF